MSVLPAGSTPWLIGHELRLYWRGIGRGALASRGAIVIGMFGLGAVGFGFLIAWALRGQHFPLTPPLIMGADMLELFVFTLMLSLTIARATQIFYERGDLDLLLSSPLPARRVLTARCLGMAMNSAMFYLLFVTPFVLPGAILGHPEWLSVYPVLVALSLLATSVGLTAAMVLFSLIGPRATRTLAQVLAAVIGAGFYMVSQLGRYAGRGQSSLWADQARAMMASGAFAADRPAAWPARALLGEPIFAGVLFGGAFVLFLLVVNVLGTRFARDAAAASGVGAGGRTKVSAKVGGFTGGPFQAMLRKELRLMRRDVMLISQVLLRVLYLFTPAVVLWKKFGGSSFSEPAMAGWLTFMSAQIAATFAWITMSGEEGFELLAAAPTAARLLRRAKLTAALVPTAVIVAVPLVLMAYVSPRAGLAALLGGAAASLSASLIAIWYEKPMPRSAFRRRRGGSVTAAFGEFIVSTLWASAAAILTGMWWPFAAAPAILAIVALFMLQRPQRTFAEVIAEGNQAS